MTARGLNLEKPFPARARGPASRLFTSIHTALGEQLRRGKESPTGRHSSREADPSPKCHPARPDQTVCFRLSSRARTKRILFSRWMC